MNKLNGFVAYATALGVLAGSLGDCRLEIFVDRDLRCDAFALVTSASTAVEAPVVQDTITGNLFDMPPWPKPGIIELV